MNRRREPKSNRGGVQTVLIFAEDQNDSAAIRIFVEALSDTAKKGVKVEVRRDPPSLTRNAGDSAMRDWIERIVSVVDAEKKMGKRIRAVLVHQDADGADPEAVVEAQLNERLESVDVECAAAVVPVQMMEAWWLLHRTAIQALKPGAWKSINWPAAGDVDSVDNPKLALQRCTMKAHPRHEYAENMSHDIALKIVELGFPKSGQSRSWARFEQLASDLLK